MRFFGLLMALAAVVLLAAPAGAATVPIISYDAEQTPSQGSAAVAHLHG